MKILVLYLSTVVVFLAADAFGLRYIVKPVFDRHIAHLYAEPFRMGPALLFYLGYVAGILWFVSVPALRTGDPLAAVVGVDVGLASSASLSSGSALRCWAALRLAQPTGAAGSSWVGARWSRGVSLEAAARGLSSLS